MGSSRARSSWRARTAAVPAPGLAGLRAEGHMRTCHVTRPDSTPGATKRGPTQAVWSGPHGKAVPGVGWRRPLRPNTIPEAGSALTGGASRTRRAGNVGGPPADARAAGETAKNLGDGCAAAACFQQRQAHTCLRAYADVGGSSHEALHGQVLLDLHATAGRDVITQGCHHRTAGGMHHRTLATASRFTVDRCRCEQRCGMLVSCPRPQPAPC